MARILTDETSLSRRKRRLVTEGEALSKLHVIEAVGAGVVLLGGLTLFFTTGQTMLLWVSVILGILAFGHWWQAKQNLNEGKSLEAGIAGEAEVTKKLGDYLDNRYFVFNDIVLTRGRTSAQLDHLVVGPNGVFVIETKNWRGRVVGDVGDRMWRQLRNDRNRATPLSSPYLQNQRHKDVVVQMIEASGLEVPDVVDLLVNRNRRATFEISGLPIPILEPSEACEYIARHRGQRVYSEEEVDKVVGMFMKAVGG